MIFPQVKTVQICSEKLAITMGVISVQQFHVIAINTAIVFVSRQGIKIHRQKSENNVFTKIVRSGRLNSANAQKTTARKF